MRTLLASLGVSAFLLAGLSAAPAAASDSAGSLLRPGRVCRPVLGSGKKAGAPSTLLPDPVAGCQIGKPAYVCDPVPGRPIPIPIPFPGPDPTTSGGDPGAGADLIPVDPPVFWSGREICYRLSCKAKPPRETLDVPVGPPLPVGSPTLYCVAAPITPPPPPPSDCTEDADCNEGSFCRYPIGACGGDGQCTPREVLCPLTANATRPTILPLKPVCGCNGKTFESACAATQAGQSILHLGPCDDDGKACPEIYAPVCGTDGVTYPNACFAGLAGVGVAHDGPCDATTNAQ